MNTGFDWTAFYPELANKILQYKDKRIELLSKVFDIFEKINMSNYFKDSNGQNLIDICPFTVMGIFNRGLTSANRIAILKEFAKLFDIDSPVPESFDGIPVLNLMMSRFFDVRENVYDRDMHINKLWELFEIGIQLADNPNQDFENRFSQIFDFVISQPYSKWNITFGLYWIRPYSYITLDSNTRAYLNNNLGMEYNFNKMPSGNRYLEICSEVKIKIQDIDKINSFPALSGDAWVMNHEKDSKSYWLGGASYGDNNNIDVSKEFIDNGVYAIDFEVGDITNKISDPIKLKSWIENISGNAAKKAFELFTQMKQGDKIAIKSVYAKEKVSLLRIKAIGTVLESFENGYNFDKNLGHTIPVEWEIMTPNVDYKIGGYWHTINKVTKQQDIETIFGNDDSYLRDEFVKWLQMQKNQMEHHILPIQLQRM